MKFLDSKLWFDLDAVSKAATGVKKFSVIDSVEVLTVEALEDLESRGVDLSGLDPDRIVPWTVSTGRRDRMGDRIDPSGWDLKDFKKTGQPILLGHDYTGLPIGRGIDVWVDEVKGGKRLRILKYFPTEDVSPIGAMTLRMIKAGFVKNASVGFIPLKAERDPELGEGEYGYLFKRQSLIESSVVSVPANPDAIVEAKSLGIDVSPYAKIVELGMDAGVDVGADRSVLESVSKAISTSTKFVVGGSIEVESEVKPSSEVKTAEVDARDLKIEELETRLADLEDRLNKIDSDEKSVEEKSTENTVVEFDSLVASIAEMLSSKR